jgi:hypothetical protein
MKNAAKKKLRVIMLADESLLPNGDLKDFSEKQRELRKTEFDVRDAMEALGHDRFSIGVSDDLSTIRGHRRPQTRHRVQSPRGVRWHWSFRPARGQLS